MPKDVLIEIINKKLFLELALTILVFLLVWSVVLKLGLQILGIKTGIKKIISAAAILCLYSLLGKQFIPKLFFGLIIVVLIALLLRIIGKVSFLKALWAALIAFLIMGIGTILIQSPLCSIYKDLVVFFIKNPLGCIVGSLIEMTFPAIALFILSTFKLALIPPVKTKFTRFDFWGILTFGLLFYSVYSASLRLLTSLHENSQHIFTNLISEWVAAITTVVVYYIVLALTKRQREYEREKYAEEKHLLQVKHSGRLIESMESGHRLMRDRLQMICTMAELGRTKELMAYISEVAAQINRDTVEDIESPEITSAILAQKVLAREKGVEVQVTNNFFSNTISVDPNTLAEIISNLLERFVAAEIVADSPNKTVFLQIDEDEENHYFVFKNSDQAVKNLPHKKFPNMQLGYFLGWKTEAEKKFLLAEALIKETGGISSSTKESGHIVELTIKYKKPTVQN